MRPIREREAPLAWTRITRMVRKELRQLFRDPKTKRIIFVSPIFQLIIFGYAVNTDVRGVRTALVDNDRSPDSRALVDAFGSSGYFRVVERSDRVSDLTRALDGGRAVVGIVLPTGFGSDLRSGRGPSVQILLDGSNSNTATVAQGYALRVVRDFARRQGAEAPGSGTASGAVGSVVAASAPVGSPVELRARAWFNPDLSSRAYNVPAVIGVIVMLMSMMLTSLAVVRERELGTLDQLLVSPLRPWELMLGKTLPVAGVAMIQLLLVTVVALVWFGVPLRGSFSLLVAVAVLFIVAGLSFGLVVSTVSATQQEAFLGMFLLLFPAIILSGFLYPVDTMPEVFQHLTLLNPLRHFLEVVRGIFLKGAGLRDLAPQILWLSAMAGTGLWLGARRFRAMIG